MLDLFLDSSRYLMTVEVLSVPFTYNWVQLLLVRYILLFDLNHKQRHYVVYLQ